MQLTSTETNYFYQHIASLLTLSEVQKMNQFVQHGNTSCLSHCISVAYYSYLLSKRLKLKVDVASLIRGSLLHDFFLYDWHDKHAHPPFHGFNHPSIAFHNANKHFQLTTIEKDIILHHMWPLTLIPPHSKEAYIVCFIDKWCSLKEVFHQNSSIEDLLPYITNIYYDSHII